jgi:hypothetical protein
MPAKTCIVLALTVLFGALAIGNPFLSKRAGAAAPRADVHLVSLRAGAADCTEVPAGAGYVLAGERVLPPCPDAALQPLVSDVQFDADGRPLWILRDGRVLRQDAATVTATAAAGP